MELTLAQIFNLLKYAGDVKSILDVATSNEDVVSKLKEGAGPVFSILEKIGATIFPKAAAAMQPIGAAIAAYDPNVVKWVQSAANQILKPAQPLAVDGIYGPMTRDAVMQLQEKMGVKVDGIAGRLTQAAIDAWFAKQAAPKP